MKKKLHLILTGIMFPVLMHAQLCLTPAGKVNHQQHSMQGSSKNAPQVLFPFALSGYYREDFEGATFPPAGWQLIDMLNPVYTWQASTMLPFNGFQSAKIAYDLANAPGEDWLILPQFIVAASDSFSFRLALQYTGWPPDSTFILISTTDSNPSSFTSVIATLAEGLNYPTVNNIYQYYSYSLSAYAGSDVYVAIKNKNTYGDGVYIDRVEIGTRAAVNAVAVSIDMFPFLPTGTTYSPTATVLNDGYTIQSFFTTMTIGGAYSSVKNVTNLAPGASQQITFDPWTSPGGPTTETVSVQTQLTGDLNPADDSLSMVLKILEPFTNYGWTSKAFAPTAKWGVPLASINTSDTSYLFAMGGHVGSTNFSSAANEYLPDSNSWTSIPNMPVAAAYANGASYNHKVYLIGGYTTVSTVTNANRIYDPATNTWSSGAPMPIPVGGYALGVYHDSLFYYIGGSDGTLDYSDVQIYNAASDTWTTGINIPHNYNIASGGISGNKIVVSGGFDGNLLANTYLGEIDPSDPSLITWTVGDDYPAGPCAMPAAGASLDASSGLVVFTGGALNNMNPIINSKATFAYDVNTNQWKIGAPKITPASNLMNFAAVVHNDSLYMVTVGGWSQVGGLTINEWLNMGPYVIPTGVADNNPVNSSFTCYPNPFVNVTDIKFSLSQSSAVKSVITDLLGQEVEVLCDKNLLAGNQHLQWDAAKQTSGIYFCRLTVNGIAATKKLIKY